RHIKRNCLFISCAVICEPISSTMLFLFVYFMVRDFGYTDKEIGKHAGVLTSSFFATQILSTPLWSLCYNGIGRKPALLVGLLSTSLCIVAFGLSKSLTWAVISRCLCGILNGNAPIARTIVGELTQMSEGDKATAF
ncbi:MFS general substrate transporter, partial [Massarina eburnea CBS 473.64]